jgi:hypothetical protein
MSGTFSYGVNPGMTPEARELWDEYPEWAPLGIETDPAPICPHCKKEIQVGDAVHIWGDRLWHTKPCP